MPVILAGNEQQKKKYLGRMTEQPLMCVSVTSLRRPLCLTCSSASPAPSSVGCLGLNPGPHAHQALFPALSCFPSSPHAVTSAESTFSLLSSSYRIPFYARFRLSISRKRCLMATLSMVTLFPCESLKGRLPFYYLTL